MLCVSINSQPINKGGTHEVKRRCGVKFIEYLVSLLEIADEHPELLEYSIRASVVETDSEKVMKITLTRPGSTQEGDSNDVHAVCLN